MAGQDRDRPESRLIKESWVKPESFIKAKDEQNKTGKSLYSILIRMGAMSEQNVYEFFSQATLIPFVKISDYQIEASLIKLFPEVAYREHCFLPVALVEDVLYVAMANPLDANLISTIETQANMQIFPLFASPSDIMLSITALFGPDDRYFDLENLIVFPQTTSVMPFWRESDRVTLKMDLEIKPLDDRMKLVTAAYIPVSAVDISASGKAMGVKSMIFIPPSVKLVVRFPTLDTEYEAKAQVARCTMDKGSKYILGLKFTDIKEDLLNKIVASGEKPPFRR